MKIGIIGLGKQGTHLYHTLNKLHPGLITHCYDPFVKNQLGLIQTNDLINCVDAVIIASPHSQHAQQTIKAIHANKHVFVEKPIALTFEDMNQIADAINSKNVIVRQNLKYRYLFHTTPCIGKIRYVNLNYTRKRGVPLTPFFTKKEYAQNGVMADLGSHLIDMAFYLSGWPEIKSINGISINLAKTTPSPIGTDSGWIDWNQDLDKEIHRGIDVEDRCFFNLECENCLMSFDVGWIAHQKQDDIFYLKIVGEEGTLYAHKMEIIRPDGSSEIIGNCQEDILDELSLNDFINEIKGNPVKINQSVQQWKRVVEVATYSSPI